MTAPRDDGPDLPESRLKRGAPAELLARARGWAEDRMRDDETRKHLPLSAVLEESAPSHLTRGVILIVFLLTVGFIVWASLARFNEIAVAAGEIVPSGSLRPVQHLEGGIVKDILVEDGQAVAPGTPLVILDPVKPEAELRRMTARRAALAIERERLRAFALDRAPDFSAMPAGFEDIRREQIDILAVQRDSRDAQLAVIRNQREERAKELAALMEKEETLKQHIALVSEEVGMRQKLVDRGLGSKIQFLDVQREANRARGDLAETRSRQAQARAAIAEADNRLLEVRTRLRNETLEAVGRITAEIAELDEDIRQRRDRVARLTVTAPTGGIVQSLKVRSPGDVLEPGATLAEIVPTGETLVAEVKIRPEDIGHIHVGQEAMIKVSSYDFARYGGVAGTVDRISASSILDAEGRPYFKGTVAVRSTPADDPARRILPGMTVTADIRTGEKSLMHYLLRPVYNSIDTAFQER